MVARGQIPTVMTTNRIARASLRATAIVARLVLLAVVVWTWQSQFRGLSGEFPHTHFSDGNLLAAILIAGVLTFAVQMRPEWLRSATMRGAGFPGLRSRRC